MCGAGFGLMRSATVDRKWGQRVKSSCSHCSHALGGAGFPAGLPGSVAADSQTLAAVPRFLQTAAPPPPGREALRVIATPGQAPPGSRDSGLADWLLATQLPQ